MLDDDVDGVIWLVVVSMHVNSLGPEAHTFTGSEDFEDVHLLEVLSAVLKDSFGLVVAVEDGQFGVDALVSARHVESVLEE